MTDPQEITVNSPILITPTLPVKSPELLLAEAVVETAKALAEKTTRERLAEKAALKEALKEWMDEKFATFGKWSLGSLAALALGVLMYLFLLTHGWRPPNV